MYQLTRGVSSCQALRHDERERLPCWVAAGGVALSKMCVLGITPEKIGKQNVQNRACSCKIVLCLPIKEATDFVLMAINVVVKIFDQP